MTRIDRDNLIFLFKDYDETTYNEHFYQTTPDQAIDYYLAKNKDNKKNFFDSNRNIYTTKDKNYELKWKKDPILENCIEIILFRKADPNKNKFYEVTDNKTGFKFYFKIDNYEKEYPENLHIYRKEDNKKNIIRITPDKAITIFKEYQRVIKLHNGYDVINRPYSNSSVDKNSEILRAIEKVIKKFLSGWNLDNTYRSERKSFFLIWFPIIDIEKKEVFIASCHFNKYKFNKDN